MSISISDLPVVDDLDIPVSAEDYADQAVGPMQQKPGNYRMVVQKYKVATKKDGSVLLIDEKYPVVTIEQVRIVEPTSEERVVNVYTDVRFKPFQRSLPNGAKVVASDVQDFLRAIDATTNFEGSEHIKQLFQQALDTNAPFLGQLTLKGYDKDYVNAEKAKFTTTTPKDVVNAVYSKAKLALKHFTKNGTYLSEVENPNTGNTVQARVQIGRYFPSTVEIVEGPKAGKNQIILGPFTPKAA